MLEPPLPVATALDLALRLLIAAGAEEELARCVAQILLEGDLLGHDTHGLALLPAYVAELRGGRMRGAGTELRLREKSGVALWDAQRLAGPWVVRRALAWAEERATAYGAAHVVIRRSHHIAALAAYLEEVARRGFLVHLSCSDPNAASVAPFGGRRAVITPNPMAWAWPAQPEPVLIDISASVTTNGMTARLARAEQAEGEHAWWLDAGGHATRDPRVLQAHPPGTILPLGGLDAGHKGYALGLMVEAMTAGLAGHGRADPGEGWGATVHVQVLDPEAFAGADAFAVQMDALAQACRESPPRTPGQSVRLPGERGLARKRHQLEHGLELHPDILPALGNCARDLGVKV